MFAVARSCALPEHSDFMVLFLALQSLSPTWVYALDSYITVGTVSTTFESEAIAMGEVEATVFWC